MTKKEKREYKRQWYLKNKEKVLEYQKEYYQENRDKRLEYQKEYMKEYYNTPMGRALYLLKRYNQSDKEYNRGQGDLTAEWIVENIFTKKCAYCDKEGWDVIGCNRIDNDKPHSKDNVEPCCFEHNLKVSAGRPKKEQ